MMLSPTRAYVRQAFAPQVFAGMGLVSPELAHQLALEIAAGAGPETAAWQAYYGAGGVYSQAPSVIEAASYYDEGAGSPPPSEMPAPMLYPAKVCGPGDGACISYNQQVQLANMALMENARRAFNLQVCKHNAALNPGTAQDIPCTQFSPTPVPPVPAEAVLQTAVCSGGECYTPIVGSLAQNELLAQRQFQAQYTPTGVARTGAPNQTTPPRPQPGEVPATDSGSPSGGTIALPFGLSTNTLLLAGAALSLLVLMKGKG